MLRPPRKSILTETRHSVQKSAMLKNMFSRAWQEKYKKLKKKK